MNKNEIREKIEKYDALIRYTENYDYENLPTLMFPKEDKHNTFLKCYIQNEGYNFEYYNDAFIVYLKNELVPFQ